MESVFVVGGAGYMGRGIVQACAQAGYTVLINDPDEGLIQKSMAEIEWSLKKLESKNLLKESTQTVLDRIRPEKQLTAAGSADWIIETVTEKEELKRSIFKQLDSIVPPEKPLATNTSTIPISRLAEATMHPERVVGIHFFNPIALMGLIEIIKGEKTTTAIFDRAADFAISLGKRPVRVYKDIPGFVFNRIWAATIREAVDLVADGIVTAEDVDFGMCAGFGWKCGPFAMADEAGVDTYANAANSLKILGEEGLAPRSSLLDDMVKQGRLGKKAGRGFYDYNRK
ncbi:3-hydroxyacyl-CoA dehydrogenase family protein [bacterium]|nr:3-hydroxyacyl-CoA dehydrogenase family protein [bacterium]